MTTKTYVTLLPHSITNATSRYRVVDADKWQRYVNGEAASYPVESVHDDYDSAQEAADELNGKVDA